MTSKKIVAPARVSKTKSTSPKATPVRAKRGIGKLLADVQSKVTVQRRLHENPDDLLEEYGVHASELVGARAAYINAWPQASDAQRGDFTIAMLWPPSGANLREVTLCTPATGKINVATRFEVQGANFTEQDKLIFAYSNDIHRTVVATHIEFHSSKKIVGTAKFALDGDYDVYVGTPATHGSELRLLNIRK